MRPTYMQRQVPAAVGSCTARSSWTRLTCCGAGQGFWSTRAENCGVDAVALLRPGMDARRCATTGAGWWMQTVQTCTFWSWWPSWADARGDSTGAFLDVFFMAVQLGSPWRFQRCSFVAGEAFQGFLLALFPGGKKCADWSALVVGTAPRVEPIASGGGRGATRPPRWHV